MWSACLNESSVHQHSTIKIKPPCLNHSFQPTWSFSVFVCCFCGSGCCKCLIVFILVTCDFVLHMGNLAGWEKHLYWYFIFPFFFFKGTVRGNGPETKFLKEQSQKYRLHKSELLRGCSSLLFHDNFYCLCSVSPLSFGPALPILLWKSIFESLLQRLTRKHGCLWLSTATPTNSWKLRK